MPVELRADGFYIRYRDVDGVWKYRKTTARTLRDAEHLLHEVERTIERKELGLEPLTRNPENWTLADLLQWWLDTFSVESAAHGRNVGTVTNQLLKDPIAGLRLELVTRARLEQLLIDKKRAGLGAESLNHIRGFVQRAFGAAIRLEKWVGTNPVDAVRKVKVPPRAYQTLTADEAARVLAAASPDHATIIAVALYAALRKGEVVALRKRDVDLEQGLLHVRGSNEREVTKGGHHDTIPIHPELRPYLVTAMGSPGLYVFPDSEGRMRRSSGFFPERMLRRTLAKAGIVEHYALKCRRQGCGFSMETETPEDRTCPRCNFKLWKTAIGRQLRFHDLRHTAATLMLQASADLHAVQRILRHRNPQTTMRTYGHLQQDYLHEQIARMSMTPKASPTAPPSTLATPLLLATNDDLESDRAQKKKPAFLRVSPGGADGTRTRGLRRDRPAL